MDPVVLDTDVVSRSMRRTLPDNVNDALLGRTTVLTFVTVAELLRGAIRARWGVRRLRELEEWISQSGQVDSDPEVSRAWAKLVAAREDAGSPINPNDAWIAACCVTSGLPLATLNRKDFVGIEGLELFLG